MDYLILEFNTLEGLYQLLIQITADKYILLCQLTDNVVALRRVCTCTRERLLQNYKAQRHAVFLKDTFSIEDENCSRHADLFVCLFARAITIEVPPPTLSVKISTLYHNFPIDYCRDFSHILHICTRPQVDSLV